MFIRILFQKIKNNMKIVLREKKMRDLYVMERVHIYAKRNDQFAKELAYDGIYFLFRFPFFYFLDYTIIASFLPSLSFLQSLPYTSLSNSWPL